MASGGAAGSVLRYLVSGFTQRALVPGAGVLAAFPAGTLLVNVSGSLLIGFVAGLAESRALIGPDVRLLMVTGVLGGYTTFSAFSLETLLLLRSGQTGTAVTTVVLQIVLGVAAAWAGFGVGEATGRPG